MTALQDDEILGKAYDARLMRRLLGYLRPYWRSVLVALAAIIAGSAAQLAQPYLVKTAIDRYIAPGDLAGLRGLAALYFVILVGAFAAEYVQTWTMQLTGQRIMFDLRMAIYGHLLRLDVRYYDRNPVGRLMTRVITDVDVLNDLFTSGVVSVFGDVFLLAGIMVVMLWMDWRLALVTFSVLPIIVLVTQWFRSNARDCYRVVRGWIARINAFLQENITGMSTVQLFGREALNFERFDAIDRKHRDANLESVFYYSIFYAAIDTVSTLASALIIWWGGGAVLRSTLTLGVLVAFLQYSQRFFRPICDLSEKFNILQSAMASSERIFGLLDEPVAIQRRPRRSRGPAPAAGHVVFDHVWFAYNEAAGAAARGRPSAIRPARRQLRGEAGRARRDRRRHRRGQDDAHQPAAPLLRRRTRAHHRGRRRRPRAGPRGAARPVRPRAAGRAPLLRHHRRQRPARQPSRSTTRRCGARAAAVHADAFIDRLPGGLAAPVGERGATLSVGQKQLLSFARALAFDPRVLILDEATSSVDTETELLIHDALRVLMNGRTTIVIAHRLSTIQHMDKILVLHKGRLREAGTHQELLAARGIYCKLYQLQYKSGAGEERPMIGTEAETRS